MQKTDEIFQLHTLSVNALFKIRQLINRIIIERKHSDRHLINNALFNIQSLADQLYQSQSTIPDRLEPEKIYFSKNPVPDRLDKGIK